MDGGMRLAFMGTPDFSVPALEALVAAGREIACVYAQPPRAAGRGGRVRKAPVHEAAERLGIPARTPVSLKKAEAQAEFAALDLDVAIVVAYGLILPQAILDAPRHGCINIHASLLPRWRGAAPIQRAIEAGDVETGVTIMQMDAGLDTGPMLLTGRVPIDARTTGESLHDALSALGAELVVDALDRLARGDLPVTPQPDDGATYAKKLSRDEARIDWTQPAAVLERRIRAFTPWPGNWFEHDDQRIKVLAASSVDGGGAPGTVIGVGAEGGLTVACGDGALRIERLQRAGKAPADAGAFLRGFPLPPGSVLA
jgi:methionyl-tRNA formyltransferase